jgi:sulfate adenylyltransferase
LNIKRIGYVASEISKAGGIAIVAAIGKCSIFFFLLTCLTAPYTESREHARKLISDVGGYIEVHVSTSIEVCEGRDRKGLYAKARKGILKGFTGIDDPYEEPKKSELVLDAGVTSVEKSVEIITQYLLKNSYLVN